MNMALLATQSAVDGQPLRGASTVAYPSATTVLSNVAANRSAIPAIRFTCCTPARSPCAVNFVATKIMPRSKWITSDVPLPVIEPLTLGRRPEPFSHPEWLFEIKWDGFRSVVKIEHGRCRLISRNGNEFKSFPDLALELPKEVSAHSESLV
jgi:hypothetical protein